MIRCLVVSVVAVFLFFGSLFVMAQGKGQPMTNADVIKMVQSGVPEADIIRAIEIAAPNFEITDESVVALQSQKVPEKVILAMARRQGPPKITAKGKKAKPAASVVDARFKWEVEVHGGLSRASLPGGYTLLPTPETYALDGSGAQGYQSSRVSSWYIGEGAELIGATTSLQDTLLKPMIDPSDKFYGFRVTRKLKKWLSAEFSLDRSSKLEMKSGVVDGIKAADTTFKKFWQRLNVPGNAETSSTYALVQDGGHETFTTGAFVINLPKKFGIHPYATVGAGFLFTEDKGLGATLQGSYGGPTALETDTASIKLTRSSNRALTEMVGFGIKIYLTTHVGLRLDARAYFNKNTMTTMLNTAHTNTANMAWVVKAETKTGAPPAPSIQLLSGPGFQAYSTLSGPTISNTKLYYGYGSQRTIPVSIGLFYRF
jgi:hypothetical protein